MQILHAMSTLILLPLLFSLWTQRRRLDRFTNILLSTFLCVMVVINTSIALMGMGVKNGWIDHLFLALAAVSIEIYFLFRPEPSSEDSSRTMPI